MLEVWKPSPLAPLYEVSNLGNVRRAKPGRGTWVGRVKKKIYSNHKHRAARCLPFCGATRSQMSCTVGELVLDAFVGPRPLFGIVKHLNNDLTDDRLENLEWR